VGLQSEFLGQHDIPKRKVPYRTEAPDGDSGAARTDLVDIHIPAAANTIALASELVAALYAGPEPWRTLALGATILGILIGAAAIMTGLLEYLEPSVAGIDLRLAARHGVRTSLAWCAFAAKTIFVAAFSPVAPWSITVCLAFDLLGCVLLVQGVYLGTKQVYEQLEKQ
jgi:uncharacterized membrane protein